MAGPRDRQHGCAGLLVASTAAGEGKTLVASAIARHLREAGCGVEVFLPVATGCRLGRGGLVSAAADMLAASAESQQTLREIAPVRVSSSAAPGVAAATGGRAVDVDAIFDAWRRVAGEAECVVAEAPGGLCCPIADGLTTLDLAERLALPVVLVIRADVGAPDRALLAAAAARARKVNLAGCVMNFYPADSSADAPLDDTLQAMGHLLKAHAGLKILTMIPDDSANNVAAGRLAKSARFATGQVQWERLCGLR